MFVKQDAPSANVCRWRVQSEGMPLLHGYIGQERVVILRKKETLRRLLVEMFPKIVGDGWEKLDEIGERVRDMAMGCCVLRVEPRKGIEGEADQDFSEHTALPLWKSFQSLNLMLPKEDRSAMLLRVFNDTTPLVNMGIQKTTNQQSHQTDAAKDAYEAVGETQVDCKEEDLNEDNLEVASNEDRAASDQATTEDAAMMVGADDANIGAMEIRKDDGP